MKWLPAPPCAMVSEDGRHTMNRTPQEGFVPLGGTVTYTLVTGGKIVAVERDVPNTPAHRKAAIDKLKELCE